MDIRLVQKGIKVKLKFPGKLIFSNFDLKSIQLRMKRLEKYLNELGKLLNLSDYREACAFFDIVPCVRILFSGLGPKNQSDLFSNYRFI